MKRTIFITLFLYFVTAMFAMQVNSDEAMRIANSWMSQISSNNAISGITAETNPVHTTTTDWYSINFSQGGFVLISADDKSIPILGFDISGSFTSLNAPQNLKWFTDQYHEQFSLLRTLDEVDMHPAWQEVRTGNFTGFMPNRPVSPLIQTTWDQDWPYNSLCPSDAQGPGGHVYAGCGATTMGQIVKFWQYPTQGTGSHSYTHPTYGPMSANFATTTYNYAAMPNSLFWTANTQISTLLLHCGIAMDMDYAPDGSGASTSAIRGAFVNYFGYETTAQTVYQSGFTTTAWETMLRNELDQHRPIFYFGTDPSGGGHAFVCDGYQGTNYFHMNWGWSGSSNGYFYLSNLNPESYHFNTQQGACIGLRPTVPVSAPTNLTATIDPGDNVFLQWQSPVSRALLGYTIYRNNVLYTSLTDPLNTNYFDINLAPGTYQYYIVANFSQGDSQPSNVATITIYPAPVINFQESFENFADFNSVILPWYSYDLDLSPTQDYPGLEFPNEGEPQGFIVFNPVSTIPPISEYAAYNGQKMLACFGALNAANNDWFCSPKWNTGSIGRMRFWARSANADSCVEKIKIGLSTSSPEPASMSIVSGSTPISVPGTWTEYNFTFPNNLYSNVFVGIQCVSTDGYMLLIDRLQLMTSYVDAEDEVNLTKPDIKLQVYPNPFGSVATFSLLQKQAGTVTMKIYDIKGQLVKTLLNNQMQPQDANIAWNGTDNQDRYVSNGIYFCRIQNAQGSTVAKIVRMK